MALHTCARTTVVQQVSEAGSQAQRGNRNHEDCCQALSCTAVLGVCTRQIARRKNGCQTARTQGAMSCKKWLENRAVDLNLLASDGPGIEDWADVVLAQKYTLDISENPVRPAQKEGCCCGVQ